MRGVFIILSIPVFLFLLTIFTILYVPGKYIVSIFGPGDFFPASLLCSYPAVVRSDAMAPKIKKDSRIYLNKCASGLDNLEPGMIILFQDFSLKRLVIIQDVQNYNEAVYYKAYQESKPGVIFNVYPEQIMAVYETNN